MTDEDPEGVHWDGDKKLFLSLERILKSEVQAKWVEQMWGALITRKRKLRRSHHNMTVLCFASSLKYEA